LKESAKTSEMNNSTSETVVVYDDLQCLTLTPTTTLSDVVAATIHDISVDDVVVVADIEDA
jgi:hypothetical protein